MKKYNQYISQACCLLVLVLGMSSCFQDLDQDPPFNYPEQPARPIPGPDDPIFYMPFEDNYEEMVTGMEALQKKTPGFKAGKVGKAYSGAKDAYLTYALGSLYQPLGSDLTISFWYKVNNDPNRAGILVIAPEEEADRKLGIRLFREASGADQRMKALVGTGTADVWLDGGANSVIPANDWVYVSLTATSTEAVLYFNGEEVKKSNLSKAISFEKCNNISIGSGEPGFVEWNHLYDLSLIDELRIFPKAQTPEEIKSWMNKAE